MLKSTRRQSPALIVAIVALVAALAGSAIALPGKNSVKRNDIAKGAVTSKAIKKNSVKSKHVKNDSLRGVDINESTLGKVPSAAAADTVSNLKTFGPVNVAQGAADVTLVSHGPLSLIGSCDANAALTETHVLVATTEENSLFGGDDLNGDLDPATAEADRTIEDPGASSSADPEHSDGYDDQFSVIAPSGAAMHGTVSSVANGNTDTCTFYGSVTVVK